MRLHLAGPLPWSPDSQQKLWLKCLNTSFLSPSRLSRLSRMMSSHSIATGYLIWIWRHHKETLGPCWKGPVFSPVTFIWRLTDFCTGQLISKVFLSDLRAAPIFETDLCHLMPHLLLNKVPSKNTNRRTLKVGSQPMKICKSLILNQKRLHGYAGETLLFLPSCLYSSLFKSKWVLASFLGLWDMGPIFECW